MWGATTMRDVGKDTTHMANRLIHYSWVFEKWYEKVLLVFLVSLGLIKIGGWIL